MDLGHLHKFDEVIQKYRDEGVHNYLINMKDVTAINSSGISKILNLHLRLENEEGSLALAELSPICSYVLELTQLIDVFKIYATQSEAMGQFS